MPPMYRLKMHTCLGFGPLPPRGLTRGRNGHDAAWWTPTIANTITESAARGFRCLILQSDVHQRLIGFAILELSS